MSKKFSLNPEQQAAVLCIDRPLLVLAGAGSGKTRVITEKVAYLIETCGIKPHHIGAVTFTNKAAQEMKHRISQRLGHLPHRGLSISTFHTLGLKILRAHPQETGLGDRFSIYDETDAIQLIRGLEYFKSFNKETLQSHLKQISDWKNEGIRPDQAHRHATTDLSAESAILYEHYQKHLAAFQAVDFDDLIARPVQLFREHPAILNKWQNKLQYILVDEYQDTNTAQYELMRLLTQARETFTVVGDDDQSIYSWRGAKPENLVRLQTDFPRLQLIKLEQNYRSTNTILTAANHLIQQNTPLFPKSLWSQHGQGDAIRVIHTASEYAEAEFVAGEIAKLHGLHHVPLHHFAILYRGNFQAQWIEEQLQVLRLPYTLSGGTSMFSRIEIRDLICYLRVLTNPQDDAAFLRIANTPKRGIGPALCETLRQVASNSQKSLKETLNSLALLSHLTAPQRMIIEDLHSLLSEAESRLHTANLPSEVLNPLLQKIDYQTWLIDTSSTPIQGEKRWNQVERFIQWMDHLFSRKKNDDPNFTLSELLSTLMLMDQLDQRTQEEGTEHIQLMTLHAAKGLEFPRVYIIGVEENLLPHKTSIEEDTLPEERRLAYVGITRAQTHLTLTLARTRQSQGEKIQVNESRFLQEIPSQLLSIENPFELGDTDQISDRNKNNLDLLKSKFLKKSSS